MNQAALSYTPLIVLEIVIGALAGFFGFNSFFVTIVSCMGIVQTNLPTQVLIADVLDGVGLAVVAYATSLAMISRVRKNAPNKSIAE